MEDLFGVKMQWIMYALLAVFVPSLAVIGFMGLRNRVMLKMALRNIPAAQGANGADHRRDNDFDADHGSVLRHRRHAYPFHPQGCGGRAGDD